VTAPPPAGRRTLALVVDDEPAILRAVSAYLEQAGFDVAKAGDGESALAQVCANPPDVVVLDLMLPDIDGVEVCRRLRAFSNAYVLMRTARADEVDTLIGLSVGADDYLTKPFSPRVLLARIQALLRRPRTTPALVDSMPSGPTAAPSRTVGDLRLDPASREVTVGGGRWN
jgi:DNA-binding response OmpR family regulator